MQHGIERIEILLLIAAVVAMIAQRLRVPYTVGLVVAGVLLAMSPLTPQIHLTKELIFTLFLPPLVFEAALHIRWIELRRDLLLIVTLASVGVVISAAATTAAMHYLVDWPWTSALVFGVLIAATDPVSVIANFKEAGVTGRLRLLVEAESLFNDSTAAVAFTVAVTIASGASLGVGETAISLVSNIGGGILCGAAVTGVLLLVAGRTTDHLVEITLTSGAAYGSFLLAEHFHWSGVLASLTAGLLVGNVGVLGSISARGREAVVSVWDYAAFVVNSLIFLLIGVRETQQSLNGLWLAAGVAVVAVLLGRALAIYPLCLLFSTGPLRVSRNHQHVLFWGGLRGALALALALGLPESLPYANEIVSVSFAVVAFSVIVQGLTMVPFLRRLGETNERTAPH